MTYLKAVARVKLETWISFYITAAINNYYEKPSAMNVLCNDKNI